MLEQSARDLRSMLDSVEVKQSHVIEDMDELVKLAKYQRSKGGS